MKSKFRECVKSMTRSKKNKVFSPFMDISWQNKVSKKSIFFPVDLVFIPVDLMPPG